MANVLTEYAYTTVATVLDRLSRKGLVSRRMDGRTIRFTAIGTQGAHTAVLMHDSLKAADDPDTVLVHFAETLSKSEAETLRLALDRLDHQAHRAR